MFVFYNWTLYWLPQITQSLAVDNSPTNVYLAKLSVWTRVTVKTGLINLGAI